RDRAVQQETGEQPLKRVTVEVSHQISGNSRAQRRCQFERHTEANVGGMALKMYGGTGRGGGNNRDQAGADRLPDGNSKMQSEDRREKNPAADTGQRSQQACEETQQNQERA